MIDDRSVSSLGFVRCLLGYIVLKILCEDIPNCEFGGFGVCPLVYCCDYVFERLFCLCLGAFERPIMVTFSPISHTI